MLHGHATSVQFVSHAPGGQHLASAALDGEIRLWDIRRGVPVGRFLQSSPQPLGGIAFSGRHLLAAFACGRLRLWDAELGTTLATFAGKSSENSRDSSDPIASSAVVPEVEATRLVALGRHSGRIEVWDPLKSRLVSQSAKFHVARIVGLAWTRLEAKQRRFLLSASEDRTVKVRCFFQQFRKSQSRQGVTFSKVKICLIILSQFVRCHSFWEANLVQKMFSGRCCFLCDVF